MEHEIYTPSNSTEGSAFEAKWCTDCSFLTKKRNTDITDCTKSMINYAMIGESRWFYSDEGEPFCPKFKDHAKKAVKDNRNTENQLCLI